MSEAVGAVGRTLATVPVVDSIGKAIHSLQRAYQIYEDAPNSVRRLTHTGNSISRYLATIDADIANNSEDYPADFLVWVDEAKVVVETLAHQIRAHTSHIESLSEGSTLRRGLAHMLEENRMSQIESLLVQQLGILSHIVQISQKYASLNTDFDSRERN